jgi:hypothetical protein
MKPPIVVVSTGYCIPEEVRAQHVASIASQKVPVAAHVYHDAKDDLRPSIATIYHAVRQLSPEVIVLSVDADDWLIGPDVTARVLKIYEKHDAWMTWGSYVNDDGLKRWHGNTSYDVPPHHRVKCRRVPWFSSHLKTWRAGLFQQIAESDFKSPLMSPDPSQAKANGWITDCVDLAFMFPMLEMAAERGQFISDKLYVYNHRNPYSVHNAKKSRQEFQKQEGTRLRTKTPYERLKERPW